jgi:predicted metal-dependent hydrolase
VGADDTPATILQGGRPKAYRPLRPADRRAALRAGLAAYRRGDFFQAHELLEPAWMGSPDESEREFLQGLIKLAAAYVHSVRGNPLGMAKNLRGARARLVAAAPYRAEIDVPALLAAIDERLAGLAAGTLPPLDPPTLQRSAR